MALKAILTTEEYDALGDSPYKGEYVKDGEGFRLDVEEINGLKLANASALSANASSAIAEKAKVEKKLKGLQEKVGDFDLNLLPQAREALEKMDGWDPDEKLAAHKKQFEEQTKNAFANEYSQKEKHLLEESNKLTAILGSRTEQLKRALFESHALALCSQFNADPSIVSVMRDRGMVNWEEDQENGELSLVVMDDHGNKKLSIGPEGKMVPTSLEDLFKECRNKPDKWGIFFRPPDKSGSGAGGSAPGIGGIGENPFDPKTLNLTKQVELYRRDPETARRLAAAAGTPLPEIPK